MHYRHPYTQYTVDQRVVRAHLCPCGLASSCILESADSEVGSKLHTPTYTPTHTHTHTYMYTHADTYIHTYRRTTVYVVYGLVMLVLGFFTLLGYAMAREGVAVIWSLLWCMSALLIAVKHKIQVFPSVFVNNDLSFLYFSHPLTHSSPISLYNNMLFFCRLQIQPKKPSMRTCWGMNIG